MTGEEEVNVLLHQSAPILPNVIEEPPFADSLQQDVTPHPPLLVSFTYNMLLLQQGCDNVTLSVRK